MADARMTRRRFLCITAGLAGGLVARAAFAAPAGRIVRWRGRALGAAAEIQLVHDDPAVARAVLEKCRDEIARLELLFSLTDPDSALSRLNRLSDLDRPAFEMVDLLAQARALWRETGGAFDITVQPLWRLYADHFAAPDADPAGPGQPSIGAALQRVDGSAITATPHRVAFARDGMAATLNGIAQGYITDRVAGLLRRAGFADVLVHLGETAALGAKPDGTPWRAAVAAPDGGKPVLHLPLRDLALATSGGYGTQFSTDGRHHHLFDPHTGCSARRYRSVSVVHRSAALADGLSTAFASLQKREIARIVRAHPGARAILIGETDTPVVIG